MKISNYFDGETKINISDLTVSQAAEILTALDNANSELANKIRKILENEKEYKIWD